MKSQISVTALLLCVLLTGCDSASKSPANAPLASTAPVTFEGQIRNDAGFFESGSLQATDATGKQVARNQWQDANGHYSIEIPAGTAFPVLLTAKAKSEASKSVTLQAAVISPTLTSHDISPNSTKIAEKAKTLGGYTKENMMQATLDTVNRPQGDRSVEGFRGDPTKQFGGWH
jgi:hypothetical protein